MKKTLLTGPYGTATRVLSCPASPGYVAPSQVAQGWCMCSKRMGPPSKRPEKKVKNRGIQPIHPPPIWHAMFNDTLLYLYRYLNVINQYMLHVYLIKLFPRPVCFDATWQLYTGTFLRGWPNYRKNMMPWLPCFDVQLFFPCVSLHRVRCCSSFLMLKNMPLLRGKWWFNVGRLQLVKPVTIWQNKQIQVH